jgi:hypothetical protein
MSSPAFFWVGVALAFSLGACSTPPRTGGDAPTGIDGIACVETTADAVPHAVESADQTLLAEALGASGKGGICAGKVLVVQRSSRVFRVWDARRAATEPGRWWAPIPPGSSREEYRGRYAICSAWSALDRLVSCDMKAGAVVLAGSTQSADCDEGTYAKSGFVQIYVRNDAAHDQVFVENCRDEGSWP